MSDTKYITVYVDPETHRELKQASLDYDKPIYKILLDSALEKIRKEPKKEKKPSN